MNSVGNLERDESVTESETSVPSLLARGGSSRESIDFRIPSAVAPDPDGLGGELRMSAEPFADCPTGMPIQSQASLAYPPATNYHQSSSMLLPQDFGYVQPNAILPAYLPGLQRPGGGVPAPLMPPVGLAPAFQASGPMQPPLDDSLMRFALEQRCMLQQQWLARAAGVPADPFGASPVDMRLRSPQMGEALTRRSESLQEPPAPSSAAGVALGVGPFAGNPNSLPRGEPLGYRRHSLDDRRMPGATWRMSLGSPSGADGRGVPGDQEPAAIVQRRRHHTISSAEAVGWRALAAGGGGRGSPRSGAPRAPPGPPEKRPFNALGTQSEAPEMLGKRQHSGDLPGAAPFGPRQPADLLQGLDQHSLRMFIQGAVPVGNLLPARPAYNYDLSHQVRVAGR